MYQYIEQSVPIYSTFSKKQKKTKLPNDESFVVYFYMKILLSINTLQFDQKQYVPCFQKTKKLPNDGSFFYAPAIFNGEAYSITTVRTSVHLSVPSVRPVRNTNGFHAISFERIGVLY